MRDDQAGPFGRLRGVLFLAIGMIALATMSIAAPAAADDREVAIDLGGLHVMGDTESRIVFGAGVFNVIPDGSNDDSSAVFLAEFRFGKKLWIAGPAIGITANSDGGVYGYAGIYGDFMLGDIVLTPFVGAGAYSRGNSKDLGGTFEIRSSIEAAYEFENRMRVGVQYAHLSNAGINKQNFGEEELYLTFSFPIGE